MADAASLFGFLRFFILQTALQALIITTSQSTSTRPCRRCWENQLVAHLA
jgi:hypothetical protein